MEFILIINFHAVLKKIIKPYLKEKEERIIFFISYNI